MNNITGRQPYQKTPKAKKDRAYLNKVKQLPCCVCGRSGPSDAHHWIHDRFGNEKTPDREAIPLCKEHHQDGPNAIHNGKLAWRIKYGADHSYSKLTQELVARIFERDLE